MIRADFSLGKLPLASASPASLVSPVRVPTASKKLVNTRVKTSITPASTPMRPKAPKSNAPIRPRSGIETIWSGRAGTLRFQPPGFLKPGPSLKIASAMTARMVVATMPMSSAPLTLRAMSTPMMSRPSTKMTVGMVLIDPPSPSCTGGAATPLERTNPESTRPMNAMNRPMPTVIAVFSGAGTALKIISRRLVADSSTMIRPLMTTRPIASAQVT